MLVADDRVDIDALIARPPAALAGLLEVRGLGILQLPHQDQTELALVADLSGLSPRLPLPERHASLDLPLVRINPAAASAPARIAHALDCALGRTRQIAGSFRT